MSSFFFFFGPCPNGFCIPQQPSGHCCDRSNSSKSLVENNGSWTTMDWEPSQFDQRTDLWLYEWFRSIFAASIPAFRRVSRNIPSVTIRVPTFLGFRVYADAIQGYWDLHMLVGVIFLATSVRNISVIMAHELDKTQ